MTNELLWNVMEGLSVKKPHRTDLSRFLSMCYLVGNHSLFTPNKTFLTLPDIIDCISSQPLEPLESSQALQQSFTNDLTNTTEHQLYRPNLRNRIDQPFYDLQ